MSAKKFYLTVTNSKNVTAYIWSKGQEFRMVPDKAEASAFLAEDQAQTALTALQTEYPNTPIFKSVVVKAL